MGSLKREIMYLLLKIAVIAMLIMLLFTFLFGIFRLADVSMSPAVKAGDLVVFYRLDKTYRIGDSIVLKYEGKKQVRRVIAAAGDTVDVTDEGLSVNGALQQEEWVYGETLLYTEGVRFPVTVGEGQIFVLGDSREGAVDSRIYGAVDIADTLGKLVTIIRRRDI